MPIVLARLLVPGRAALRWLSRAGTLLVTLTAAASAAFAETPAELVRRLMDEPAVRQAIEAAHRLEIDVIADQVRLCEIPAPTFAESRRAAVVRALFERVGLRNVRVDEVGNVLGDRPGRDDRKRVVLAAHLDTVFPEGTDLAVRRDGVFLRGPGIGDNCRGLAVLIGIARILQQVPIPTAAPMVFVANVAEEGLGNLRGVRHLFGGELRDGVGSFVSIDGSGAGFVHLGVGTRRYRVSFRGPGGHSYFAFGRANPMHALGRAVAAVADFDVPADPRVTFSVGLVGGGTSVNAIAAEAWMEVDLRSHDGAALDALDARLKEAVDGAVERENARWDGRGAIAVVWEAIGHKEPGSTPADSPIVRITEAATRALGLPVKAFPATTDANVPMSLGIPAVTIDGGGDGSGGHSLNEVFDTTDSWKGTQRALLLALALAQM